MINEQTREAQDRAVTRLPLDKNLNGSAPEDERILQQLDEVTLAAAKSAKDYRAWMLEHMRVNINAAPHRANRLASTTVLPDFAGQAAGRPREEEKNSSTPEPKRQLPAPAEAVYDYRAKAFELINANVNATLEYARRLANVRSPAEFIELSTNHARKHFELIMAYAAALGASLATTKPNG